MRTSTISAVNLQLKSFDKTVEIVNYFFLFLELKKHLARFVFKIDFISVVIFCKYNASNSDLGEQMQSRNLESLSYSVLFSPVYSGQNAELPGSF